MHRAPFYRHRVLPYAIEHGYPLAGARPLDSRFRGNDGWDAE